MQKHLLCASQSRNLTCCSAEQCISSESVIGNGEVTKPSSTIARMQSRNAIGLMRDAITERYRLDEGVSVGDTGLAIRTVKAV